MASGIPSNRARRDGEISRLADEYLSRSRDLHCVVDGEWVLLWTAGAWTDVLGWSETELSGLKLDELVHRDDVGLVLPGLARPDRAIEYFGRFRHSDGSFVWLAWTGMTSASTGRVTLTGRDVTKRVARDVKQGRELSSAAFRATHDPLTGLANRTLLEEYLTRAIARSNRSGSTPLVLFVDLDNFKAINDEHGHQYGDEVLRGVAARLEAAFRPSDLVARYGGDEFVLVMEGGDAALATERVEQAVAGVSDLRTGDGPLRATVGAVWVDSSDTTPAEAIAGADRDMYARRAKFAAGGNGDGSAQFAEPDRERRS